MKILKQLIALSLIILVAQASFAQPKGRVIDEVVAVIGDNAIFRSEVEAQLMQMRARGMAPGADARSQIFEDMLFQHLLLNQAKIDSIEVTEQEVERQLDRRINMFVQRIGSEEQLEEYFNKPIYEIENEFRETVREQMIAQRMQQNLTGDLSVSPSEVKKYYQQLHKDSIPRVPEQYKIAEIVRKPPVSSSQEKKLRKRLNDIRQRIIDGSSFSGLAVLYSEDEGSASNGGDLGFVSRGSLVPEFAAVAFNLEENEISRVVKTKYGFHIMKLLERRGDQARIRHILLKPDVTPKSSKKVIAELDSIVGLVKSGEITFAEAAREYSVNEYSRVSGGIMRNPKTGSSTFKKDEIPPAVNDQIKNLEVGEISRPFKMKNDIGNTVFKVIRIEEKNLPHKATLDKDYQLIKEKAIQHKREKILDEWIKNKIKTTYINIKKDYKNLNFKYKEWAQQ